MSRNTKNVFPLHKLMENKAINLEMIKYFLEKKSDLRVIDRINKFSISHACSKPLVAPSIIQFLIEEKCELNSHDRKDENALHRKISEKHFCSIF